MRIAVCFSSLIRTGCSAAPNILRMLGNDLNVDFFIHTWDHENQAVPFLESVLRDSPMWENIKNYRPHPLQKSKLKKFLEIYNPKSYQVDDIDKFYSHYKQYPERHIDAFPLWTTFYESVKLKQEYEVENGFKYDYVVKIRPDVVFEEDSADGLKKTIEMLEETKDKRIAICNLDPNWTVDYEYSDDVFFVGDNESMDIAGEFGHYGSGNHLYFLKYLVEHGITPVRPTFNQYTILRTYTQHLDPLTDWQEIALNDGLMYILPESFPGIFIYNPNTYAKDSF